MPAPGPDLAERLQPLQAPLGSRMRRDRMLVQMIRAVNSSLDPDRVGEEMVSQIGEWLPVSEWLVYAVDEGGRSRTLGVHGLTPGFEQVAEAIGDCVVRTRTPFSSADVSVDPRLQRDESCPHQVAAVALPLGCRGRTVGAIVGLDHAPAGRAPELAPATLDALLAALEPGAVALDNALRVQRAEALSVTDDLTQLYNSRYLAQALRREIMRAERCGRPLSVLFIDLDGFKSVNDAHGHLAGSRALIEAAGAIKATARETDVIARFGGDEFCVVLPDTGSDGAVALARRVGQKIAAHRFLESEGLTIALTLSVGVATFPDVSSSAEGLLRSADEAMYWVKDHGKNGIHAAV